MPSAIVRRTGWPGSVVGDLFALPRLGRRATVHAGAAYHPLRDVLVVLRTVNRIRPRMVLVQGPSRFTDAPPMPAVNGRGGIRGKLDKTSADWPEIVSTSRR
jgi:hypothetical protein